VSFFQVLAHEAQTAFTPWLVLGLLVAFLASRGSREQPRFRAIGFFLVLHLLGLFTAAALADAGSAHADVARLPAWMMGAVVAVASATTLLFSALLPRLRLRTPLILRDVVVALGSLVACVSVASRANVNLSGLIATSAVLTAVLGFSLQDVIGNVAGGLALQLDDSIGVGDWVRVGDVSGQVADIRWRQTSIETRNGETVLVPNAVMMKSTVVVVGRRQGERGRWRRHVVFHVDWSHQPSEVVAVVEAALRSAALERVAREPAPSCVLQDMADTFGRYDLRYWLTDFAQDDGTDSEVRTCIYFALQRAEMRLAQPTHSVLLTEDSLDRKASKARQQLARREALLERLELFRGLEPAERESLARSMRYSPFTRGEALTQQGADAHWLYLMEEGTAVVKVSEGALEREVAVLTGPNLFGEMSLLTGEPRSATVIASSDVECFRLEKESVQALLQARPALALQLAELLASRRVGLLAAREHLDADALAIRQASEARDLLSRIRRFLELG
jgi:small-conductance mechanosensitive channel/CRP-like cAMP-binding protein